MLESDVGNALSLDSLGGSVSAAIDFLCLTFSRFEKSFIPLAPSQYRHFAPVHRPSTYRTITFHFLLSLESVAEQSSAQLCAKPYASTSHGYFGPAPCRIYSPGSLQGLFILIQEAATTYTTSRTNTALSLPEDSNSN